MGISECCRASGSMDCLPDATHHAARARTEARRRLDAAPDFAIRDGTVSFRQTFETVAAEEPFFTAPQHLVDAAKNLLTLDISDTVAKVVRDNVVVRIGCSAVPPFALVHGCRDRTLFVFRCVYDGCTAFLDIRRFSGVDRIKWILMGVSHCHDFSSFPPRVPRSTFSADTLDTFARMVQQREGSAAGP